MSDTSKQATERGSECNDGLGQPLAWLHTVRVLNGDPGELDEALSFAPDNFPLGEVGLFESMSVLQLYGPATIDAAVAAERERCAQLCEDISDEYQRREGMKYPELKTDAQEGASKCAAAIRKA